MIGRRGLATLALAGMLAACGGGGDDASRPAPSTLPKVDATAASTVPTITEPLVAEPLTVPDKSGAGPAEPLTVHLVAENDRTAAEAAGLYEFARLVEEMSDGTIEVEIEWQTNTPPEVWDANPGPVATTHRVVAGEADMGFSANTYWAYEGVETTRPANAPLWIRSAGQAQAVAEHDDLVADLFGGLSDVGVVGLAMFPQGFKVLVNYNGPLASPADLAGLVLRSRAAPELFDFYTALGTTPQQDDIGYDARVSPTWASDEWQPGTAVGNLPIHFAYYDVYANAAFWNGLTDDQRDTIREAALRARDYVGNHLPEDSAADDMSAYCDKGGVVTWIGPDAVAAFEAAAEPVIAGLRGDPVKAELLDRIAALGEHEPPTIYPACDGRPSSDPDAPPVEIADGVYRFEVTEDDLDRAGIPADDWQYDTGVYTFTLTDGTYRWTQQSPTSPEMDASTGGYDGHGTYTVTGDRVTFTELGFGDPVDWVVSPTVGHDGSLTWTLVGANRQFVRFMFGEPWIRIGDA